MSKGLFDDQDGLTPEARKDYDARHNRYPQTPGHKEQDGASKQAAEDIRSKAGRLRSECLSAFQKHGAKTADEVADLLGCDILSIRPRITELYGRGFIAKTDARRASSRGKPQTVWQVAPQAESEKGNG